MVKVKQTITLELESSGQKLTVDLQEAKDIVESLSSFVNRTHSNITKKKQKTATKRGRKPKAAANARSRQSRKPTNGKMISMSETKRQEVIDHVQKQLSARPKTLSALLKGISFVPNYLPAIRQMVESRGNVSKEVIGKRTYYSRKATTPSQKQTRANTATP